MNEITLPTLRCLRCGHTWSPRKPERPVRCPKCGSPYWGQPRKHDAAPHDAAVKAAEEER